MGSPFADQHLIGHMPKKKRRGLFLSALISLDLSAIRTPEYAMSNVSSNSKLLSCGLLKQTLTTIYNLNVNISHSVIQIQLSTQGEMMQHWGSLLLLDAARHMPHHLKVRRTLRSSVATGTLRKALLHGTVGTGGGVFAGGIFRGGSLADFPSLYGTDKYTRVEGGWFWCFGVCLFFFLKVSFTTPFFLIS